MFRMTQIMQTMLDDKPLPPARKPPGPVVIWNLVRRCNLTCKHCYSISADKDFPGELSEADTTALAAAAEISQRVFEETGDLQPTSRT